MPETYYNASLTHFDIPLKHFDGPLIHCVEALNHYDEPLIHYNETNSLHINKLRLKTIFLKKNACAITKNL